MFLEEREEPWTIARARIADPAVDGFVDQILGIVEQDCGDRIRVIEMAAASEGAGRELLGELEYVTHTDTHELIALAMLPRARLEVALDLFELDRVLQGMHPLDEPLSRADFHDLTVVLSSAAIGLSLSTSEACLPDRGFGFPEGARTHGHVDEPIPGQPREHPADQADLRTRFARPGPKPALLEEFGQATYELGGAEHAQERAPPTEVSLDLENGGRISA